MTDVPARLTERLRKRMLESEDFSYANTTPRDAATLILIDRSGPEPKLLLGRRHARHTFMPGKFVFPGGRAELADRRMAAATPLHPQVEARLMDRVRRPSAAMARGLALAAIRETQEETGLLLGCKNGDGALAAPDASWQCFVTENVQPALGDIHFIARAITPPRQVRRYDTRFFAIDYAHVAARIDGVVGPDSELTELVWIPVAQAKDLDMPQITRAIMGELETRIAGGFGHELPVPFYRVLHRTFLREWL